MLLRGCPLPWTILKVVVVWVVNLPPHPAAASPRLTPASPLTLARTPHALTPRVPQRQYSEELGAGWGYPGSPAVSSRVQGPSPLPPTYTPDAPTLRVPQHLTDSEDILGGAKGYPGSIAVSSKVQGPSPLPLTYTPNAPTLLDPQLLTDSEAVYQGSAGGHSGSHAVSSRVQGPSSLDLTPTSLKVRDSQLFKDSKGVQLGSAGGYPVPPTVSSRVQGQEIVRSVVSANANEKNYTEDSQKNEGNTSSPSSVQEPFESQVWRDDASAQVTRRSADAFPSAHRHRHRHSHAAAPLWLREHLKAQPGERRRTTERHFEEKIAAVFRGVAYRDSASYRTLPVKRQGTRDVMHSGGGVRIERTTTVSEEPQNDYAGNGRSVVVDGNQRNQSAESSADASPHDGGEAKTDTQGKGNETTDTSPPAPEETKEPEGETLLELQEYDSETYDQYEGHYTDLADHSPEPEVSGRGDSPSGVTLQWQLPPEQADNATDAPENTTNAPLRPSRLPKPRVSWLDVLRCTNRSLAWVLINFFLGFLLLSLCLLGPYRLLTMRCCSPLLPRTHYVAVHLLVFVATSLKAVYLFHLAFGSRGRLPLVLVLLLTNTGFPCFSSAFLVLMIMMFLAADVQVYKSKLFTAHNTFIFIVMMLTLCFVADVIVGCAHSRSLLVLSRVMVIVVVVAALLVYARKHQAVLHVSELMKREFQGELKLLVLPAKDEAQQRQMGIKHILRNRLSMWCRAMKVSTACLALLSFIHLLHTIFLISSHVPTWAWWMCHVSGCLVEALLAVSTCVAAALTQRYDESVSFPYSFMVPPLLLRGKSAVSSRSPVEGGETIYQRVSFSSGTESTQYTACYPDAGLGRTDPASRTPQAPKRRGASVKRSATFSHTPQLPHSSHLYSPLAGQLQGARGGSASHIPLYSPGAGSHRSIYGPNLVSHIPVYTPTGDTSVLVHEDGFVRIRNQTNPDESVPRPHGSLIMLQQAHFRGSNPQIRGCEAREMNGPGRHETLHQSLSRRRRTSRGSDVLQNNIDVSEGEYQSSPSSRQSYGWHSNLPSPHSPARDEADYRSLSRRRSGREHHLGPLSHNERENYDYHSLSWRRRSSRDHRDHQMNNLDRPESDYRSLTRRQVSREDNNDPVHHNSSRRSIREPRPPPLNLYEEHSHSPGMRHKVTNHSFSPSSPTTPPPPDVHNAFIVPSPRSRRQARFPKPFVRVGSNRSLQEEDAYGDYIPRGNPLRRNHSSAGYYPSRYLTPSSPSLMDAQRYASLRVPKPRKRQPNYVFSGGKLLNRDYDTRQEVTKEDLLRSPSRSSDKANGYEGGADGYEGGGARECPSRQSNSSKRSDGTDQDWAIELIKSSSMLTDFYSLKPDQKKKRKKEEIPEEQEE